MRHLFFVAIFLSVITIACSPQESKTESGVPLPTESTPTSKLAQKVATYKSVKLNANLDELSDNQKKMIPILIEAAKIMDDLFWYEAYGEKDKFLETATDDAAQQYMKINYGPWDRLDNNEPFLDNIDRKPAGANFYPADMTKEEFELSNLKNKSDLYTFIRRDAEGVLVSIPYHVKFKKEVSKASELLLAAAELADDNGFKNYLTLRAQALLDDQYQSSDFAWLDMKDNLIDLVIGPIETYEDQLFGYKAAHEAFVLIKDKKWSARLAKYASFLPELQAGIPVPDKYKQEKPGTDTELNAYDVIYYAGDCNAGSKTIAINLPNDEEVQLQKGTRRLQLKNSMKAKFDHILLPIAKELIAVEQMKHISFDAFFSNTMFHEVAHGLGIKKTINGKGTVRKSLKEHYSALEEGKADILGLYMIKQLHKKGEIEGDLNDYLVTFMASIFRSVRFGAASAHGKANMIRFNYFQDAGAFTKDVETGRYKVDFDKLGEATDNLAELILTLQGDGDYDGVSSLVKEKGIIKPALEKDLNRLTDLGIPIDIVFEQGTQNLGL